MSERPPRIGISFGPTTPEPHFGLARDALNRSYTDCVRRAGGVPLGLAPAEPDDVPALLDQVHGLVLSGGGDLDPAAYGESPVSEVADVCAERDRFEFTLARVALERSLPLLAICRGAQILNVVLGGTLIQHLRDHPRPHLDTRHDAKIERQSRLCEVVGADVLSVNSLHHQAVCELGAGVVPVAWSSDGIVEAFELSDHPEVLAVQWHPELPPATEIPGNLFEHLVQAAADLTIESAAAPE